MDKALTSNLNLEVSVLAFGGAYSEAQLIYDALDNYAEYLLQRILDEHKNENYEDAASFWEDYRSVLAAKRTLFAKACNLSEEGFRIVYDLKGQAKPSAKADQIAQSVKMYRKQFGI